MLVRSFPENIARLETSQKYEQTLQTVSTFRTDVQLRLQAELRVEIDPLDFEFPK
jgi:hypothetical protein